MHEPKLEKHMNTSTSKDDTQVDSMDRSIDDNQWGFSHTDPKVIDDKERFDGNEGGISDDEAVDVIYSDSKSTLNDLNNARSDRCKMLVYLRACKVGDLNLVN